MDATARQYFAVRPYLIERYMWNLEIQGDFIALGSTEREPGKSCPPKRGDITEFSRASRLRMLKTVARIDWKRADRGLFVTLTYPTGKEIQSSRDRNIHLDRFHDRIERFTNKKIPLLWRVEWKPRKSGARKGFWAPHFHLIVFGVRWIPHQEIRRWWRETLDYQGHMATDVDTMSGQRKFSVYIAKYCAKVPASSSLDYASYPKVEGRHWGVLRRGHMPFAGKVTFRNISGGVIRTLQAMAAQTLPDYNPLTDRGFCFLGKRAADFREAIEQLAIDEGCIAEYD